MFTNYWNIACRTLLNHKSYVLINVNTFARPEAWQRFEPFRMLVAGADEP